LGTIFWKCRNNKSNNSQCRSNKKYSKDNVNVNLLKSYSEWEGYEKEIKKTRFKYN